MYFLYRAKMEYSQEKKKSIQTGREFPKSKGGTASMAAFNQKLKSGGIVRGSDALPCKFILQLKEKNIH